MFEDIGYHVAIPFCFCPASVRSRWSKPSCAIVFQATLIQCIITSSSHLELQSRPSWMKSLDMNDMNDMNGMNGMNGLDESHKLDMNDMNGSAVSTLQNDHLKLTWCGTKPWSSSKFPPRAATQFASPVQWHTLKKTELRPPVSLRPCRCHPAWQGLRGQGLPPFTAICSHLPKNQMPPIWAPNSWIDPIWSNTFCQGFL